MGFWGFGGLAALCHDLGHAPFSHCMEFCMPPVGSLDLTWPRRAEARGATHEDYTVAILEKTELGRTIDRRFAGTSRHVASLIDPSVRPGDDFFVDGGLDHRRLLAQIVSSELDVDRMDYLVRDALFTGAAYGQVDVGWLLSNLDAWVADGQVHLAMSSRAVYAFDHFLLARHHMFMMVYFHHTSVIYEELLRRYVTSDASTWVMPSDLEQYRAVDDPALMLHLRASSHPMARRVVEQRPYRRLLERHGDARVAQLSSETERLREAGIDAIDAYSTGRLSRYAAVGDKRRRAPSIYVVDAHDPRRATRLREASSVFERYADERVIARLYVAPEDLDRARATLGADGPVAPAASGR